MNLFNEYYKTLVNEMASNQRYRGKTKTSSLIKTGKRSREISDPSLIKKANSLLSGKNATENFNQIKLFLQKGKIQEAYDLAEKLKNTIRDLTTYKIKKQRDLFRKKLIGLIDATNTPYHSFDQVIKYNKRQFKLINTGKVIKEVKNKAVRDKIIEYLPYWNGLYYEIGTLLTTYDMFDDPSKYSTTIEQLESKNNEEMYEFASTSDHFKTTYYKPQSISDSSHHKEKTTITDEDYDKVPIFFMTSKGPACKLITIPITLAEKKQYPNLKSREDNIPLRRDVFVAKTNRLFGEPQNEPPIGFSYRGPKKVVPELGTIESPLTVNQVKEKINHDKSFTEFLKKYPIQDDIYLSVNPNGTLKFRVEYHRVMAEARRKGLNLKDRSTEIEKRNQQILEKNKLQGQQKQTNPTGNLKGFSNPTVSNNEEDKEEEND